MRLAYQSSPESDRATVKRKTIALGLAILAHLLLLLLLLRIAPEIPAILKSKALSTFTVLPTPGTAPVPAPRAKKTEKIKKAGGAAPTGPKPPAPPKAPPVPPKSPPPPLMPMLIGGKEMFDAADISKLPQHSGREVAGGGDTNGSSSGKDSGSAYGPGEGPGGVRLYNAEWYREPTNAEINTYLPHNFSGVGWADIACQTIDHYHVDNCGQLGESPVGSGLSRAMRQAAWQFLVRPPRVGGKATIGAWVRIHISFGEREAKESERSDP